MKRFVYTITILIVLFSTLLSVAAEKRLNLLSFANKEKMNIGDRIKLDVVAEDSAGFDIIYPEVLEKPGEFDFIESFPVSSEGKKHDGGRAYILSIYTTGPHVIPPVEVMYKTPSQNEWSTALSPQIPIVVVSLLTGDYTDIRDIKGIIIGFSRLRWGLAVFSILLAIGAWLWFLKIKKERDRAIREALLNRPPHEVAYSQLVALRSKELPEKGLVKEYYTELSDIVRHYLEARFNYRVPEMTTEEFLQLIKESPEVLGEHEKLLKEFLIHCDMVKFAKYGPTKIEMLDSFKIAENLVDKTKLDEEEEEKEK